MLGRILCRKTFEYTSQVLMSSVFMLHVLVLRMLISDMLLSFKEFDMAWTGHFFHGQTDQMSC